ncbi:hypothetical protein [Conexibacter woesei]|uniref:hypothetical protein n=1 Tax=Conexibacter woesei TaxID=191495 RepID=UPI0002D8AF51|nr:hypothetical protein [Conexibacter woesei]
MPSREPEQQPSEALRAAQLLGVDLHELQARTPGRVVTKDDVLRAVGVTDADDADADAVEAASAGTEPPATP